MNSIYLKKRTKLPDFIDLPASKSISNRLLILKELSGNKTKLINLSNADDTILLQNILNELKIGKKTNIFNLKNAGTTYRFLTCFFSQKNGIFDLQCDDRMKQRPIKELVDALRELGSEIYYTEKEGFPPLKIIGKKLEGKRIKVSSEISSQFVSSLLMIAATIENGLELELKDNSNSMPYILMTLKLLEDFGIKADFRKNVIFIKKQEFKPPDLYTIEADWSASAVWFAFVSLTKNSKITINKLHKNSIQGDSKLTEIYKHFGIETTFTKKSIIIKQKSTAFPDFFEANFKDTPDLTPTFAVNLCLLGIKYRISGIKNLKIKESDRIFSLISILKNFGYILSTPNEDTILWDGKMSKKQYKIKINPFNDHRMAMAASLFSVIEDVEIINPQCVVKSYPGFFEQLTSSF